LHRAGSGSDGTRAPSSSVTGDPFVVHSSQFRNIATLFFPLKHPSISPLPRLLVVRRSARCTEKTRYFNAMDASPFKNSLQNDKFK